MQSFGPYLISIFFSLFLHWIYKLIYHYDGKSIYDEGFLHYNSLSNIIKHSNSYLWRYIVFRISVPLFVLLMASALIAKLYEPRVHYAVITVCVYLLMNDFKSLRNKSIDVRQKLWHKIIIVFILTEGLLIGFISVKIDLSFLAPDWQGIIDGIWTSIIIAVFILFFFKLIRINRDINAQTPQDEMEGFVIEKFFKLYNKYNKTIQNACEKNNCSKILIYSILIYESLNRPTFFRKLENIFVRLPGVSLTVGIAQVKSPKALSDEESICIASEILAGSASIDISDYSEMSETLLKYNKSQYYADEIIVISNLLRPRFMHINSANAIAKSNI